MLPGTCLPAHLWQWPSGAPEICCFECSPRSSAANSSCAATSAPGRGRFWIFPWRSLNVVEPVTGDCYCGLPEGRLPVYDLMLSQKLLLENDPQRFFAVANRHPSFVLRPRSAPPTI